MIAAFRRTGQQQGLPWCSPGTGGPSRGPGEGGGTAPDQPGLPLHTHTLVPVFIKHSF